MKKKRSQKARPAPRPPELPEDVRDEYCLALVEAATARAHVEAHGEQLEAIGLRLAERLTAGEDFESVDERVKAALARALERSGVLARAGR